MIALDPPRPSRWGILDSYSSVKLRSGSSVPGLFAVFDQADNQCLYDPDPAVVSPPSRDAIQIVEAFEDREIRFGRFDLEAAAGKEQNACPEIGEREGERLTEVSIARVSKKSRAGITISFDHFWFRSAESSRIVTGHR